MTRNKLKGLLLMFIEQDLVSNIQYNDIIEELKNIVPFNRRLILYIFICI